MRLEKNARGTAWVFSDAECQDFAWICSCMPIHQMTPSEAALISVVDTKFRASRGGWLTEKQWNWFEALATKHKGFISQRDDAVKDIRALAAKMSGGAQ